MIKSEHFYELAEHSPDGISLADENGNILYVNNALSRIVQRPPEEIIQSGRSILFKDDDKELLDALWQREQTGFVRTEIDIENSKGRAIPVEISSFSYIGHNGKQYYSATYRDITERKAKETELLEIKTKFQALSDSAFEGIAININGVIQDVNNTMAAIFGYKPNEMRGLSAEDLVAEECVEMVRKNILNNYEEPYKVKGRKKNGDIFPVEVIGKSTIYKGRNARITSFRDITQIISAEKEIKRYEIKFQTLFQNGSDMLALLNEKGEYIYASPSVERILGYKAGELTGKSALEFVHADDLEKVLDKLNTVLNDATVVIPDFRFKHANGNYLWIETILDNMLDNKHVRAISASSRDITQRKHTEIALKQREFDLQNALNEIKLNEQKFRSLFEQNPNAVFSIDNNGIITSANNAFTHILQLDLSSIIGQQVLSFFNLNNNIYIEEKLKSALDGVADTFVTEFVNIKGCYVKALVTIIPIIIDEQVNGAYCVTRDITESWQNEQRLRATKQMLQNAANNLDIKYLLNNYLLEIENIYVTIQCSISLLDKGKLNHYIAPSLPESQASLINGVSVWEQQSTEVFSPILVMDVEEETSLGLFKEILIESQIEALISYPLISSSGMVLGFFTLSYKDKNNFSEKHIEIASQLTKLIALVMDNRSSLENIKRQNKELLKINTELDRFAYSTSHELRAPLTSIKGLITLAMDEAGCTQEVFEYLTMIERSAIKLEKFILEIGEYYLNKSTVVNYKPVQLQRLVTEQISNIKQTEEVAAEMKFNINIDPDIYVVSDPARLDIILNNIFDNAVKYRDDNKQEKYVQISAAKTNESVEITVEDNGIGIPEPCLTKVCNMFYRANESSVGSGLGLYIVSEIISRLNGKMEIRSKEGKGTSVKLVFPADAAFIN